MVPPKAVIVALPLAPLHKGLVIPVPVEIAVGWVIVMFPVTTHPPVAVTVTEREPALSDEIV